MENEIESESNEGVSASVRAGVRLSDGLVVFGTGFLFQLGLEGLLGRVCWYGTVCYFACRILAGMDVGSKMKSLIWRITRKSHSVWLRPLLERCSTSFHRSTSCRTGFRALDSSTMRSFSRRSSRCRAAISKSTWIGLVKVVELV